MTEKQRGKSTKGPETAILFGRLAWTQGAARRNFYDAPRMAMFFMRVVANPMSGREWHLKKTILEKILGSI